MRNHSARKILSGSRNTRNLLNLLIKAERFEVLTGSPSEKNKVNLLSIKMLETEIKIPARPTKTNCIHGMQGIDVRGSFDPGIDNPTWGVNVGDGVVVGESVVVNDGEGVMVRVLVTVGI